MGDVRIRDLDTSVVLGLKARARRHGRTLQEELKTLLTEAALRPRRELAEELRRFQHELRASHGELPDSTQRIREERDRWG
jgi:plasmid stability protein